MIRVTCPACNAKVGLNKLPPIGATIACDNCGERFPFRLESGGKKEGPLETAVESSSPPPLPPSAPPTSPPPVPVEPEPAVRVIAEAPQPVAESGRIGGFDVKTLLVGLVAIGLLGLVFVTLLMMGMMGFVLAMLGRQPAPAPAPAVPTPAAVSGDAQPGLPTPPLDDQPQEARPQPPVPPAPANYEPADALAMVCLADSDENGKRIYRPVDTAWALDEKHYVAPALLLANAVPLVFRCVKSDGSVVAIEAIDVHPEFPTDFADRFTTGGNERMDALEQDREAFHAMMFKDVAVLSIGGRIGERLRTRENVNLEELARRRQPVRLLGFEPRESAPDDYSPKATTVRARLESDDRSVVVATDDRRDRKGFLVLDEANRAIGMVGGAGVVLPIDLAREALRRTR